LAPLSAIHALPAASKAMPVGLSSPPPAQPALGDRGELQLLNSLRGELP